MIWGMTSGGWMSGLTYGAKDMQREQLDLLAEYGLHAMGWGGKELMAMDAERRAQVAAWLADEDVHISLGANVDYFSDDADALKRATDEAIRMVETLAKPMRSTFTTTGIPRNLHHYSRDVPVAKQIDILSKAMAPLAKACAAAGAPLAIHTVCHYGADFAEICKRTPGLGLLFDTANCFIIGEPPLLAADACAPYIVGTHFKDSYVSPSFNPLGIKARGAVLGQGDANLREIYKIILKKTPNAQNLVMEMEIDPVEDGEGKIRDAREVLRECAEFVKSL
jgi:sugar phosphate isomerase/epimerase